MGEKRNEENEENEKANTRHEKRCVSNDGMQQTMSIQNNVYS